MNKKRQLERLEASIAAEKTKVSAIRGQIREVEQQTEQAHAKIAAMKAEAEELAALRAEQIELMRARQKLYTPANVERCRRAAAPSWASTPPMSTWWWASGQHS